VRPKRGAQTTVAESSPSRSSRVEALLALVGVGVADGLVLVAHREEELVGAAVVRLHPPDAELVALVTEPNHRHQGVGRLLVRELERRARIAGCTRLRVRLPRRDDAAHSFFARMGFEDTHVAFDRAL